MSRKRKPAQQTAATLPATPDSEALADESLTEDDAEPAEADEASPEVNVEAATPDPELPASEAAAPTEEDALDVTPPVTFNPDGIRYSDLPPELGVPCECLVNTIWRGVTVGPGTRVALPAADVERLERKGIVKRV